MPPDFGNPQFLYRYRPLTVDQKNPERDVVRDELHLIEHGLYGRRTLTI